MKRYLKLALSIAITTGLAGNALAGNEQRAGSAGATELLINPWARSSGWGGVNSASVRGLEAQFLNVAGTAFTQKTEIMFSHTNWFGDADISINAAGLSQKVGDNGVLGIGLMSMNFGDIPITTVEQPEGGIGTYSPQLINFSVSYAQKFTENIYGGVNIKLINQSIPDLNATGICFDAGIQYVTGENDKIKFGIAIKNVGPAMRFSGDGMAFKINISGTNGSYPYTAEQRGASFELPSLLNIGGSYDVVSTNTNRASIGANFTSNSFTKDQIGLGLEWAYKEMFMVRGAYVYEEGMWDESTRTTIFSGITFGASFEVPMNKTGSTFAIDYAYRHTTFMGGISSIGARINL
jgi:hypothetical protein